MFLSAPRLLIRPLVPADLENFHSYRSNPEVCKYQGFDVMVLEEAEIFILENARISFGVPGQWVQYAIALRETDRLIGDCALKVHLHEPQTAGIGITVSHLEQRKGYAKEAFTALGDFLFDEHGINRIEGIADTENEASIRLLQSTGFRQDGPRMENVFFKGQWGSEYRFVLQKNLRMEN